MVHLCLDEALCKHLSKSNLRPKYYWKYGWNFLEIPGKNHEILSVQKSWNHIVVGSFHNVLTVVVNCELVN